MYNNIISKPDYLFEVSWEVCNKVGGIHTVISTKALSLVNELRSNYILIGPDVRREESQNQEFIEDKKLFKSWRDKALEEGLRIKIGRWDIVGKPIAIIVDFTVFINQKDAIFSKFWETYKLDSISGQWDYAEPSLFGYAAAKVIESFIRFNVSIREKVVAQFHEWMTGTGLLYLKENTPQVGTLFTTHATVLGRAIAGNGQPLYSALDQYNSDAKALEFGVVSKQSLEKIAAQNADCFTTVSVITSKECAKFLNKEVDLVTPNGFEATFVPKEEEFDKYRYNARQKLVGVSESLFGYKVASDAFFIANSGRYEFLNKGIDIYIDSLGKLNKSSELKREVIAFILIPANHYGPRKDLANALKNNEKLISDNSILTHNLHYADHDPILQRIAQNELLNKPEDKVKVIFVPSYLNGDDGIFNIKYYDLLIGFDLTVFPSYYEPWGYTPLESLAFHVPTVTTNLTGFGMWVNEVMKDPDNGVFVANRTDDNEQEVITTIVNAVLTSVKLNKKDSEAARKKALEVSCTALWKNLIKFYYKAFDIAIQKVALRVNLFLEQEHVETFQHVENFSQTNAPVWKRFSVQRNIPEKLKALEELSKNLWWCWNYDAIELFNFIDPELWKESENNPIIFLDRISYNRFQNLEKDDEFLFKLNKVYDKFKMYMEIPARTDKPKVAYFSMEFGLHDSLKIFSGGLGLLAGDYLKEASDYNYDIVGVGLMYRYGYFKQTISSTGDQLASYEAQQFSHLPITAVRDERGNALTVHVIWPGRTLNARIWRVDIGRIKLYLLDTDFEDNIDQDKQVTHHLYGGDWENRLKQEILLGIGGIRVLNAVGIQPDIYHCNEGHAAFIGIERLRKYIVEENLTFNEALEIVRASTLFTTHTPVPAGHDAFDENMMRTYLGHYPARLKITWEMFMALGKSNPNDPNEKFSMSFLAANCSQEINGVSRIHGRVSREIFKALYTGYSPEELHIGYVTNGVHLPTWTAKEWINLYKKEFGDDFLQQQHDHNLWNKIYDVSNHSIWKIRNHLREMLINYIKERLKDSGIKRYENPKLMLEMSEKLNKHTLTIGFARRFATYKRAHLLFTDLVRLSKIINNPAMPIQFLFAGKAHPYDKAGQDLIKKIIEISKMPEFLGKIIFLTNYEIGVAKMLVQGVDIWLNTPTRPLEASGTSGEKAVMNGVLHFSVLDGWWAEGYQKQAGWALPEEQTYDNPAFQDQLDAETIYSLLENEIAPLYYFRDEDGIPIGWVNYIKNCIAFVGPNFTMNRQLIDYDKHYYSRLFNRSKKLQADDYEMAKDISSWKKRVKNVWESIEVISVTFPDVNRGAMLGKKYMAEVKIDLNLLSPDDICVEMVIADIVSGGGSQKILSKEEFELDSFEERVANYKIEIVPTRPGMFEYGIRILPKHPFLPHRQDFNYLRWIES